MRVSDVLGFRGCVLELQGGEFTFRALSVLDCAFESFASVSQATCHQLPCVACPMESCIPKP